MKILMVNHYAIPPTEAGGTRHYSLAKELIKLGHEVEIVAANFNHQTKKEIIPNTKVQIFRQIVEGVPFNFISVPEYSGNSLARVFNMMSFTRQLYFSKYFRQMNKPDIIIGSSPHPWTVLAVQKVAKRWKIPFIFEVRDLWPQSLIDLGRISPKNPAIMYLAHLEKRLYERAERIITLLPGVYKYTETLGIDSSKVVWLPNGVDFSIYDQEFVSKNNEIFTVMYAGTFGLANGLDTIMQCAEILEKDYKGKINIRLVGDGPEKERLQGLAIAKQLSIVTFDNPVPKREVPRVLSEADAFIMLLKDSPVFRWGISPNKLYDYLCSSRPVISGVNAFNNPVAEANAGITIQPENPQELADAMIRLYNLSQSEREQMGANGRKYVEENHDFRILSKKLEEVLTESVTSFKDR